MAFGTPPHPCPPIGSCSGETLPSMESLKPEELGASSHLCTPPAASPVGSAPSCQVPPKDDHPATPSPASQGREGTESAPAYVPPPGPTVLVEVSPAASQPAPHHQSSCTRAASLHRRGSLASTPAFGGPWLSPQRAASLPPQSLPPTRIVLVFSSPTKKSHQPEQPPAWLQQGPGVQQTLRTRRAKEQEFGTGKRGWRQRRADGRA